MANHPKEDIRVTTVTRFMTKMTDLKVRRHPFRHLVVINFCDVIKDHYGDSSSSEPTQVIEKEVIIQKNPDLDYINAATGILMNDGDKLPWLMICTLTNLPRTLHQGDFVQDEGDVYKVSGVKPVNRDNPDIICCFLHPDRDDFEFDDTLNKDVFSSLLG